MSFGIPVRNGLSIGLLASTFLTSGSGRLVPRLTLDFLTSNTLDPRVTFTRSTTATFVGSNGLIQTAAINAPRFDYDPITLAAKGLLIEEQRVNLVLRSEEFGDVAWSKSGSSVTADAIAAPDGATTADKLVEDTSTGVHAASQFAPLASTAYVFSIFVKAGERTKIQFNGGGFTGLGFVAIFDVSNGTMVTNTGGRGSITSVGNGWYRCSVSFATSNTSTVAWLMVNGSNSSSYTGDGASGLYLWGAQYEVGAFATSYIPTVASQVTRAADIAVMTGTNFSSWYNQSAGTIVVQATAYGNKASSILTRIQDAAATTNFITARQSATGTQILGQTSSSGGLTAGLAATNFTIGAPFKIAVASAPSDVAASVNGGTVGTSTAMTTMPVVDRLNISEGGPFYVRQITYYPSRLTNAQLQALTA